MTRALCVALPLEARSEEDDVEDNAALLQMSLYGTRGAAANFKNEVEHFMLGTGFTQGRYNPCTYYHRVKGLRSLVHGDELVPAGGRAEAKWLKQQLEDMFEIKTKVIGDAGGELKEGRILNGVIRFGKGMAVRS